MTSKILYLAFCSVFLAGWAQAQTVSVADAGIRPDTYENVTPLVQRVLSGAAAGTTVVFPKGRYDFWPDGAVKAKYFISNTSTEEEDPSKLRNIGLYLKKARNITIDGSGSLFVFHGKMTTFVVDSSENITLRNFRVDFERPTMSEMRIVGPQDGGTLVDIHPDARYQIRDGRLTFYGEGWKTSHFHAVAFDSTQGTMRYSSWKPFQTATATDLGRGRVLFRPAVDIKSGTILTVRDIIRDQVGMFLYASKNLTLENVQMHYMHGLGIVNQFNENITMRNVLVEPRAESGRVISSSADCMHFSGCRGLVRIENCRFSGAHDDPVNVHGTNLRFLKKEAPDRLRLRFMHGQTYGFQPFFAGDEVAYVHAASMIRFAPGKVKSVERASDREWLVTFEKPVPAELEVNDCVENMTWTPEVHISGCVFTRTNTRGLLLTTPRKAVIENNVFDRTGMSAILIEADAEGWYESGPVKDVLIRNNRFLNCGYQGGPEHAVIAIHPSNRVIDSRRPVHTNIRIENNTFEVFDTPVVYAKSTGGLTFTGNTLVRTQAIPRSPDAGKYAFHFVGCSDVQLGDLRGDLPDTGVWLEKMPASAFRQSGKLPVRVD
ncbi:right-handed parallel beta-helix repeat-containing protein [Siphonobacter aquaeclarae]|uniref:Right handed beta helix region n=1 Tax=Siphonobacter aquaeclarae TaxID=563176 RepID=A0A1G9HWD8_9BACT|nr:right-handed parallel beta-helix repeat-containing protein [Siphonobacter aquaeclarae]SDL16883.1 Right handed beta helix region [Siphonobacter aquaeclarae]